MEPLFDKLARNNKCLGWIIWSLGIAFLWFWVLAFVGLSEDDGNFQPHPYLDAMLCFMTFPLCFLPKIGDYDGIAILSCVLWGFFLVGLFRLPLRRFHKR
jgi:hypothetical protein